MTEFTIGMGVDGHGDGHDGGGDQVRSFIIHSCLLSIAVCDSRRLDYCSKLYNKLHQEQ